MSNVARRIVTRLVAECDGAHIAGGRIGVMTPIAAEFFWRAGFRYEQSGIF
jgi:hypothetical protein